MLYVRTTLFNIGYYTSGVLFGSLAVLIWAIIPYRYRWRVITLWNRFVMFWLRVTCNIRVKVIDHRSRESHSQPAVVMAKHQSTWETMFLQYYMAPISTILKKELMRIPFFGWGLATLKPIAIDRSNRLQALKDVKIKGVERLNEGISVLIFPEGTRMPLGAVGTYYKSGADIACSAQMPVVPVAHNAAECWPHKHYLKYPGTITVVIGEAIQPQGRDRKSITEEVKTWTESQIAALPLARNDGIYSPQQAQKPSAD